MKSQLQKLAETLPFSYEVVEDVFEVLKDFEKTKTLLVYSSQRALSPYIFLDIIRRGQHEEQANKFKRTGELWLKWSWRKMVLSGNIQTTQGALWRLFQSWKGLKRAVKKAIRRHFAI